MNAVSKIEPSPLAKLREPFSADHISKLPKETRNQIDARKANKLLMVWNCKECGGHHHKDAVHLDYVGHAALTHRLLDTDPEWFWEPVAFGQDGLPALDRNGGLWIKLTVLGVTRLGYGDADGKTGGNAIKEAIGDALRNAAMRFGAALDLWHKGDLHADEADEAEPKQDDAKRTSKPRHTMSDASFAKITQLMDATRTLPSVVLEHFGVASLRDLNKAQFEETVSKLENDLARMAKAETNRAGQTGGDFTDIDESDVPF